MKEMVITKQERTEEIGGIKSRNQAGTDKMIGTGVVEVLDLSLRHIRGILVAYRKECHCEERECLDKLKGDEIFAAFRYEQGDTNSPNT